MKNLLKQIHSFLNEELSLINKKINGSALLEILKYKIIEKLKTIDFNIDISNNEESAIDLKYVDDFRVLGIKLLYCKSPITNLNSEHNNNLLLICLKEKIYVNIKDADTKKKFNLSCIPLTGIVIPKSENFSLSYQKNSLILELILEDKLENIEKNKEDTI